MSSTSSFFVRLRRAVFPSRPIFLEGVARSGGQDWPEPTAAGGLVLTTTSTAPRLAIDGPRSLLILLSRTETAWQRAGHEVKVLPRSPIMVAPPLRHPCAPSALLRSNLSQSGRKPSRPARPSVVPGRVGS